MICTVRIQLAFTGPGGGADSAAELLTCEYEGLSEGTVDVPDATAPAAEFAIPFGSIGVGASLVLVRNRTGQELAVKINAATSSFKIKTGGIMLFAMNGLPATPITALAMVTTGTQDGEGTIDYRIFGDPV